MLSWFRKCLLHCESPKNAFWPLWFRNSIRIAGMDKELSSLPEMSWNQKLSFQGMYCDQWSSARLRFRTLPVSYFHQRLDCLCSQNNEICLFGDDEKICRILNKNVPHVLQLALDQISDWTNKWQTSINCCKCKTMSIGITCIEYSYSISNQTIRHVSNIRDLDISFSSNLKFSFHCSEIASKTFSLLP